MTTHNLKDIGSLEVLSNIFGNFDENVSLLQEEYGTTIFATGTELTISGDESRVAECEKVLDLLIVLAAKGERIDKAKVRYCIELVREDRTAEVDDMTSVIAVTAKGKPIKCRTPGQKVYIDAIKKNSVVIGVGPAGTGKTYLAVALACMAYKNHEVEKIILTRPAVEAGEKLGFLPGDLQQKVDPYLRPLYDALQEMLGQENYEKLIEREIIEIAPLAYMRGRTLSNAFVIMDEAQNSTIEQMKMFLTRMGEGSKVIVNGDITQIDLPLDKVSGLKHAAKILTDIKGIGIVFLTHKDVVRHELVQSIIKAYERNGNNEKHNAKAGEKV